MKEYDRVISDMTEVIRLEPGNALAHYHRVLAYGEKNEFDLPITDLDVAIRLNPGDADACRVRGDCHRYMEEYDSVILGNL